jgi:hypothetical protein
MSMTHIIIGAALGFIAAQGVLFGLRQAMGWLVQNGMHKRLSRLAPPRGSSVISGFIRYAAPVGAVAGLTTLAVWAIGDYLAAKSAHRAALANADPTAMTPVAHAQRSSVAEAGARGGPRSDAEAPEGEGHLDPYADPQFKVQHRGHGTAAPTLKETLLRKAEARAGADLLRETRLRVRRSQYDCEAADRATKYLKAGLDVWGFAAWQGKYFPTDSYRGATLPQCQDIQNVIDPSGLDLRSAVAQDSRR